MSSREISITLPDGSVKKVPPGSTIKDVAHSIGPRLGKAAIAGSLGNGQLVDVHTPLNEDTELRIVTLKSEEGLEVLRHSASHIMANAVQKLFPGTQVAFGPATDNGFYYDFKRDEGFTPDDLGKIEAEMRTIIKQDLPLERQEISRDDAKALFEKMGETFKAEHVADIPEGETLTLYRHGDWVDLCRGPHVPSTGCIKAIKLTSIAGAYWKGDENNPMLARLYGTAFWDQKSLDEHLDRLEEAKKRDHRRVGKDLDLFSFNPLAPAMPFFHPKGTIIYNQLVEFVRRYYRVIGFEEVITPQIVDVELFKRSGHYDNYREDMFFSQIDEREFGVKPMNCPGHTLIYSNQKRSYRDLPIRLADFGRLHRYERSGVTAGLTRARCFSQDDAHIFCREDQIGPEISGQIAMVKDIFGHFGLETKIGFSTRPDQSIGREPGLSDEERAGWDKTWAHAESSLRSVLESEQVAFELGEGDGAFYGPKIDFHVCDALKRWHQLSTIQLDFSMPKRFGLKYTNEQGTDSQPVMIHRAVLGSLERFIAILVEHTGGDFPVWLAPVQARIVPISDEFLGYAETVARKLEEHDLRVRVDQRNEKLGFKIRDAELGKIPVVMVVGKKERDAGTVSVRWRKKGDLGAMALDQALSIMLEAAAVPPPGKTLHGRVERPSRL